MTLVRTIGGGQDIPWIAHNAEDGKAIQLAKDLLRKGRFEEAQRVLEPLVTKDNAEAQYLASSFSWEGETEEEFDRRHLELLKRSAAQDFPPALYALGFHYDTGELTETNKRYAARLFMRAAAAKHAHSQWLYGLCLLYGRHGIAKDERLGIEQIREAAEASFQGALETLAKFHETGEFGFLVSREKAKALRERAKGSDVITY